MPPTQQDLFRDRRQMIGYNDDEVEVEARMDQGDNNVGEEEYENEDDEHDDDQPFDCYDPEAAQEAVRKYSPWKDNTGKTVASVASPAKSPKRNKSRPWRVDVMLRKGKGVERATTTWKQQMKERKQVFQWSGVTVVEDQSEDSVFHGIEDDEISKGDTSDRAVIGPFSPSTSDLPEVIDCTGPEVIDCTKQPLVDSEPFPPTKRGPSAIYDFQNAMRALEEQLQQDSEYLGSGNNDDDDDDDDDLRSVHSVRSIASAVFPSAPERKEQTRLEFTRREVIQSLESTFTKGYDPYERYTITTTGRAGLDPPKQAKNEYHTVFQRFQRSRLARELATTVALLPTKHFHVVEEVTEADISRLHLERTTRTTPLVRSRYRVATNEVPVVEVKQQPPAPTPTPTETIVSTIVETNQQDQSEQFSTSQDEGQVTTTSTSKDEPIEEANAKEPFVVSDEQGDFNTSISQDHDSTPQEGVSVESRETELTMPDDSQPEAETTPTVTVKQSGDEALTLPEDSQSDAAATSIVTVTPPCNDPTPGEVDDGLHQEIQATPEIPPTIDASEQVSASQKVTDSQNENISPQPIQTESSMISDASATVHFMEQGTAEATISPTLAKKSKADKWKDRLAKRKSGTRRDSDISNESATLPPTTDTENNDPSVPSIPPLTQSDPEQPLPPSPPSVDDTPPSKEKRKSTKWKQRLAEKKNGKSSPTAAHHKLLSETDAPTTPEPLQQIVETPVKEDLSMEAAAEEAYKQLMGDLLAEDETETPPVPTQNVESDKANPDGDEKTPNQAVPSSKPTEEPKENAPTIKLDKSSKPDAATQPVPQRPETSKAAPFPKDLQNSFMAFDALLRQRQGAMSIPDDDADEYSEYTIEEVSVVKPPVTTNTESLAEEEEINPVPSADNDYMYEEITVEQSYMEFTVEDEQDSGDDDSHESPKPTSTPVHAATTNLMNSRMFSTPQVAQEPTITVEHIADDEMTVLTFDQSYAEPIYTGKMPEAPSPPAYDKLNDSARTTVTVKDTIAGGSSSMQGSRKLDSVNGSHRSYSSKTSSTSDKSNKAIADVLRKDVWSRDVAVVEEALEAICIEASRGQRARSKISQFGGIMAIVRAMESHRDAESIQVAGCNALDRLALDPDTQVIIGEMGGITAILDAMKRFEGSANVHQAACGALASITRHRGATDEVSDAVQVLCASMGRHATNMQVQAKAFGAIANICMDNKQHLRELSNAGGMLTMTMALQQPWPNKAEKHEAISNLSILLRCMAEQEESGQEEEYEGYPDEGGDASDLMSVISALEDDLLVQPQETNVVAKIASPTKDPDVQCLQKIPRIDRSRATIQALGLEQASNSTQPTEPTSREHDDENCTIS